MTKKRCTGTGNFLSSLWVQIWYIGNIFFHISGIRTDRGGSTGRVRTCVALPIAAGGKVAETIKAMAANRVWVATAKLLHSQRTAVVMIAVLAAGFCLRAPHTHKRRPAGGSVQNVPRRQGVTCCLHYSLAISFGLRIGDLKSSTPNFYKRK